MTKKPRKIVTYTSDDIKKMFESTHRSHLIGQLKGKKNNYNIEGFKPGELVKIIPARPRQKKWTSRRKNYRSKYYRISAVNDFYGIVLADADENKIRKEDNERNQLIIDGYKTSDLFDLDYFIQDNFPVMLNKYIDKYKELISPESLNYNEVVNTATELSDFLTTAMSRYEKCEDAESGKKLLEECERVWTNFGKHFFEFWI